MRIGLSSGVTLATIPRLAAALTLLLGSIAGTSVRAQAFSASAQTADEGSTAQNGPTAQIGPAAQGDDADRTPKIDPVSRNFLFPHAHHYVKPEQLGLSAEDVYFDNRGGSRLHGWFIDKEGTDQTVLVCNGNTGNVSNALPYAKILNAAGFDVLLFDYQGYGKSAGVASAMSLMGDSIRAFDYLVDVMKRPKEKVAVLGISLGSVLAMAVGAHRQPAAVAVEDVFLPSDHVPAFERAIGDDRVAKLVLQGITRLILPAVDPLSTIKRLECPIFLMHGERDWLLPPNGSLRVAQAAVGPAKLWLMSKTGHAPESLEVNDREYAHQMATFFHDVFSERSAAGLETEFKSEEHADGGFVTKIQVDVDELAAVEVMLSDGRKAFRFERKWLKPGESDLEVPTLFKPTHVAAIRFEYVVKKGDSWEEDLSPLSKALHDYAIFEKKFAALETPGFKPIQIPGYESSFIRRYTASNLEWLKENLPKAQSVHERIRPRYARLLGRFQLGLPEKDVLRTLPAAEMMLEFLPKNPDTYYELGNASFTLGFRDPHVSEALYLLGHLKIKDNKNADAERILGHYLDLLPQRARARLTRKQVESLSE